MKLKKIGAVLMTTMMLFSTVAGCGAMPSTSGSDTETTGANNAAQEETSDNGQITLRVVDWSDGSATQRQEFHKKFEEAHGQLTSRLFLRCASRQCLLKR